MADSDTDLGDEVTELLTRMSSSSAQLASLLDEEKCGESQASGPQLGNFTSINDAIADFVDRTRRCVSLEDLHLQVEVNGTRKDVWRVAGIEMAADLLANLGFLDHIFRLLDRIRGEQSGGSLGVTVMRSVKQILWKGTEHSVSLCVEIGRSGLLEFLVADVEECDYAAIEFDNKPMTEEALWTLSTLLNCLHHCPQSKGVFRDSNGVSAVAPVLASGNPLLRSLSRLILAHVIDEKDSPESASLGEEVVTYLVLDLESAVKSGSHRLYVAYNAGKRSFISLETILNSAKSAVVNAGCAALFVQLNGVERCERVIHDYAHELELQYSLQIIWHLALLPDNLPRIQQHHDLVKKLRDLERHANISIRTAATGILWQVHGQLAPRSDIFGKKSVLDPEAETPEVLISFNWVHTDEAMALFARLREQGKRVWMDCWKKKGSMLHKMKETAEQCNAAIFCLSENYLVSAACRKEVLFFSELRASGREVTMVAVVVEENFRPRSWMLDHFDSWIDLSGDKARDVDQVIRVLDHGANIDSVTAKLANGSLASEVKDETIRKPTRSSNLRSSTEASEAGFLDAEEGNEETQVSRKTMNKGGSARGKSQTSSGSVNRAGWTQQQVADWWAVDAGMGRTELSPRLTGAMLDELRAWRADAPAFFLEFSRDQLHITDPFDLLRFSAALN